jgi:2-dehydro-3-deoxygalactonokinase
MPLHIVPGLLQSGGLPNVMRGEETQVLGVLATCASGAEPPLLIGLPGTHSKWVHAEGQQIHHFLTFMTGEVFAALKGHTLLGKTMQPAQAPDDDAFRKGLQVVRSGAHPAGLLSHLFSTRTLGLTGQLPPTAQADYLSGLLIGHEMEGLALHLQASPQPLPQVVLCGEPDLCRRYSIALQCWDLGTPTLAASATVQGLWRIALQAGLVDGHAKPTSLSEGTFK